MSVHFGKEVKDQTELSNQKKKICVAKNKRIRAKNAWY